MLSIPKLAGQAIAPVIFSCFEKSLSKNKFLQRYKKDAYKAK
jgi:hypothetical protein